jgi:hypothetical protein
LWATFDIAIAGIPNKFASKQAFTVPL